VSWVREFLELVAGRRLELVELVAKFPSNSGSRASWVFGMLSVVEICQGLLVAVLLRILRMLVVSVVRLPGMLVSGVRGIAEETCRGDCEVLSVFRVGEGLDVGRDEGHEYVPNVLR
jgi:hypothetical protein